MVLPRRGRYGFALVLGACAWLAAAPAPARADEGGPTPGQKQAFYAKPSVVRVVAIYEVVYSFNSEPLKPEYIGGTGSGFFVSADGFIATNAHVVEDIHAGEAAARRKVLARMRAGLGQRPDADRLMSMLRFVRATATAEVILPDGTKLPYVVRAYGAPVGEGQDVAIIKVDISNAPNLILGDSDRMQVQDKVLAIGYPGAADLAGLLDTKSQLEASVTDGAVSAKKRTTDGEPVLQVSVPITHGNSGGPAINDRGEVIGLTTFGSRNEVQGFNFLVAASTVMKFVKQAKADNTPSETHKLWHKALDEMWAGELDEAIVHFEEVMALFPPHSEAPRFVKDARLLKKEGKGKPKQGAAGGGAGGTAGVVIAIVLGLGAIAGVTVVVRRKRGPGHAMHGHGATHGHAPVHGHGAIHGHAPVHGPMHPRGHSPYPVPHGMQPGGPGAAGGSGGMMMAGRVGPTPVARTVAIGAPSGPPIAATAFGSLTVGTLWITRGLLNGQRFSLTPQGILIGRQPGLAQIVVNDSRASGKHVWIGYENGVLVAVDQGTTNGTFVNDVRFGRISKAPLKDGDIVIVSEPDCLSVQVKLS